MKSIDWPELQESLYQLSVEALRSFAEVHREETYYGFAFDCSADDGSLLLCLNTEEEFQANSSGHPVGGEEWLEERWGTGDWKYQGFNAMGDDLSERFEEQWENYEEQISDEVDSQFYSHDSLSTASMFLESVCLVLFRMEREGVFSCLQRTDDFDGLVLDHDESVTDARQRMQNVRQSPPSPDRYKLVKEYSELSWQSHEVHQIIEDQRRQSVPYSDTKLMLQESATSPPTRVDPNWWLVYESQERGFQVAYNRLEDKYRLEVEGSDPVPLSSIGEVVLWLSSPT